MANQTQEFNKQFNEQCRQMAQAKKVMAYSSRGREIVEHFILWGIAPMVGFHLLSQFLAFLFNPWWACYIIGASFVVAIWLTDSLLPGNFVVFKRIAHCAAAYILISFR